MLDYKVTISELIAQMISEAARLGFNGRYIWSGMGRGLGMVKTYYRRQGICYYAPEVTVAFLKGNEERYAKGEISWGNIRFLQNLVKRLNEFYLTGTLHIDNTRVTTSYILSSQNERLLDGFLYARQYRENTSNDAEWVARKYLFYFEKTGHASLDSVTMDDVRGFILKTAAEVKTSTLHDIFLYLKHFHMYLKESGIPAPDCQDLFSYNVRREMPIQGYVTDDELERILAAIDATTQSGSRNRAMILLSASTGLRACDLIRLKLTDIDWRKGEIHLVQRKTATIASLPLMPDASSALQDYILKHRPSTGCPELFLRCTAPQIAITDASSLTSMFKDYEKRAGIPRKPFDGKGFHGLRRRLAKKLLTAGSTVTTIAQILGHEDVGSTRQYLMLDMKNLKECALDFSGICVERRALT